MRVLRKVKPEATLKDTRRPHERRVFSLSTCGVPHDVISFVYPSVPEVKSNAIMKAVPSLW